jgi:membrane protease YdiL (CAAX protease family)
VEPHAAAVRTLAKPAPTAGSILIACGYTAALAGAEAALAFAGPIEGAAAYAAILAVLLTHSFISERGATGSSSDSASMLLPALALVPLLRILSLTMPVRELPDVYWYAVTGAPLLVALGLLARAQGGEWARSVVPLAWSPAQALIAMLGVPLSLQAYLILRPDPVVEHARLGPIFGACLILFAFAAVPEELLFRGVLLRVLSDVFGTLGVLLASALFTIVYIGSLSVAYVVFSGAVGLLFCWCVRSTSSLVGVTLAHTLLLVGLLVVWPFVLG